MTICRADQTYLGAAEKLYLQFSISISKEYTLQDWPGFG
jgi:hypothetical protein